MCSSWHSLLLSSSVPKNTQQQGAEQISTSTQDVLYCAVSESGVVQMKFTASAIMSRIYKMLIQVRLTPPIPNQKSALNLTERHFHFQDISVDSCLAPWLHFNEDKNKMSRTPAQPHCRSTPMAGDGFLEQNFSQTHSQQSTLQLLLLTGGTPHLQEVNFQGEREKSNKVTTLSSQHSPAALP